MCAVIWSVTLGSEPIALQQCWDVIISRIVGTPVQTAADVIIWELRLPRALLAVVVGAGLALAGTAMQALVRNPLADPYLLGISSGAAVGATAVITLGVMTGLGVYALSAGALLGAVIATLLIFAIATAQGGLTPLRLILTGVVLSSAFSAAASFLVFYNDQGRAAQSALYWMLGSLGMARYDTLALTSIVVLLSLCGALLAHRHLDAIAAGDDTAASLGVPVREFRLALFITTSVLVGIIVSVSGGIGFVGLIIPHVARLLVGATHRRMIPVAATSGALFLVIVDAASRSLVAPLEVPLGVITGMVGAPLFLILLGRNAYRFGGTR